MLTNIQNLTRKFRTSIMPVEKASPSKLKIAFLFWDSDFARKYAKVGTSCGTPFYPVWTGKSLSKLQEAGAQAVKGCQKICPPSPQRQIPIAVQNGFANCRLISK
jgi:hypothetical protein